MIYLNIFIKKDDEKNLSEDNEVNKKRNKYEHELDHPIYNLGEELLNKLFTDKNTRNLSFRKIPFYRLVREIAHEYKCEIRINSSALNIL